MLRQARQASWSVRPHRSKQQMTIGLLNRHLFSLDKTQQQTKETIAPKCNLENNLIYQDFFQECGWLRGTRITKKPTLARETTHKNKACTFGAPCTWRQPQGGGGSPLSSICYYFWNNGEEPWEPCKPQELPESCLLPSWRRGVSV